MVVKSKRIGSGAIGRHQSRSRNQRTGVLSEKQSACADAPRMSALNRRRRQNTTATKPSPTPASDQQPFRASTSPTSAQQPNDYASLTVKGLQGLLRAHELRVSGSKAQLIHRLQQHDDKTSKPLTEDFVMSYGLSFFNFTDYRLRKVKKETNVKRFKGYFGIPPNTALAVFEDLRKDSSVKLIYYLMTLHWFQTYETEQRLSGCWGFCEDHVREKCKQYAKSIQSLKDKKIVFDGFNEEEIHWISVDTVSFLSEVSLHTSTFTFEV